VKRSPELTPLSHDHHHGLFAAMKLKRATGDTAADARDGFLAYWHSEGRTHFAIEEDLLLPAFARHAPADHEAIVRVLVEHVDLRRRGQDVETAAATLEDLHELGGRLQAHIRHEENILFPLIESTLPHDELAALGAAIAAAEGR
jgi:iron-sulfur cluster repair protein YtfE (RIC family)